MKKFFKALALVLALALVVGVVPAQSASAKAKAKKVLYTATPTGWSTTDDTLKSSLKTKVRIYTLAGDKKAVAADHEYKAVIKSGEGIVDVTEKYVVGKKLGKAVVDIYKDEKLVGTTTVTVRKNADASTLKLQVKEGDAFVDVTADTEFVAGVTYRLALPRAKADSDERRLFVDDKAIEDVEGSARQYDVTFEAGEHTIAFEAFQGGKLDGYTVKDSIKITAVKPQPKELKQISANSFAVVFSHDMTGLIDPAKIKNDDIYYEIAGEKIVTGAIKSSVIDKEDPTRVIITRYTNFIEGETYFFHYGDSKDLSFKAAVNKLENVDTVKVSVDGNCYIDEPKAILVKYFDKDGVELDVDATPVFVITPDDVAYQSVTSNGAPAINFAAEGTATIKVTVNLGYDSETFAPIERQDSVAVTGTKKTAEAAAVKYSFAVGTPDPEKEIHYIRLNQEAAGAIKLKVSFKGVDGNEVSSYVSGDSSGYYLKSTAEDIVQIVAGDTVRGVNTGNAVILLCYTDSNNKEQVLKAFPIEVKEANKGTSNVTATLSQGTLNVYDFQNNLAQEDDQIELKVKVTDLNTQAFGKVYISLKQVDNNDKSVGVTLNTNNILGTNNNDGNYTPNTSGEIVFTIDRADITDYAGAATGNSWDATKLARVAFEITVKDATVNGAPVLAKKTLNFVAGDVNPAGTETGVTLGYKMVATKASLDTTKKNFKHTSGAASSDVTLQKTATKNGNQFYAGTDEFKVIKSRNDIPVTVGAFGAGVSFGSINYVIISQPYGSNADLANDTTGLQAKRDAVIIATDGGSGDIFDFTAHPNNISSEDVTKITVKNFSDDTANGVVAKSSNYTFTGVRVDYNSYADTAATLATAGVKQTGARRELGTATVAVSGNDVKATYTEKAGINAASLKAALAGSATDVSGQFRVTWDGINSDISAADDANNYGRITVDCLQSDAYFKIDDKTGAIYIYKIRATIKTFDNTVNNSTSSMTLVQDITVNKLYKD